ncbi:ankyrin repeat-containing domain protein [Lasiosphaeria hispida]|uniref:Ankyrin repeat-containing domain protein n=1 Tax=Lasiosphaeria hispida TaxID=260671 RepID=A0AAJ0MCR7_9PEZI|nr:ankyrin repeat-containing domain protein [Lasiosphaeria hispida]
MARATKAGLLPYLDDYLEQKRQEYTILWDDEWPNGCEDECGGRCILPTLPAELLLFVCDYLYQGDLMSLAATCHTMANITLPLLYRRDITDFDCLALRWSCTFGVIPTLERSLSYGAPVDHLFDPLGTTGCLWSHEDFINTPLKTAILSDEPAAVRALCARGANVNMPDSPRPPRAPWAETCHFPLSWAIGAPDMMSLRKPGIGFGNPEIVHILLTAGADPNQASLRKAGPWGHDLDPRSAPLLMAMHSEVPVETVELLLEYGATTWRRGFWGPSLHTIINASYQGRVQAAEVHIVHRNPMEVMVRPDSPPCWAYNREKVQLLLRYGAVKETSRIRVGETWLEMPSLYYYLPSPNIVELTQLFIEAGADLEEWETFGIPPLLAVIYCAEMQVFEACTTANAPGIPGIISTTTELITLLASATLTPSPNLRSTIIDLAPRPFTNPPSRKACLPPLAYLCQPFTFMGGPSLVPLLLHFGADPTLPGPDGVTPLHRAVTFSSSGGGQQLRALLAFRGGPRSSGLDVNARDVRGWTPLHYACFFGLRTAWDREAQREAVRLLVGAGADVRARTDEETGGGWTPLGLAVRAADREMVGLLLGYGAEVVEDLKGLCSTIIINDLKAERLATQSFVEEERETDMEGEELPSPSARVFGISGEYLIVADGSLASAVHINQLG